MNNELSSKQNSPSLDNDKPSPSLHTKIESSPDSTSESKISNIVKKLNFQKKIGAVFFLIIVLVSGIALIYQRSNQKDSNQKDSNQTTKISQLLESSRLTDDMENNSEFELEQPPHQTPTTVPPLAATSAPIITSVPTPAPTLTPTPKPLFNLNLYLQDYSKSRISGSAVGATITLYNSQGKAVGSGTQQATPYKPEGGGTAVPSVDISVPLGSYSYKAETETLQASGNIDIKSYSDTPAHQIYLYAKPITIHGKFFLDENNSAKYEEGEKIFANKSIRFWYTESPDKPIYKAGETTSNNNGDFSITLVDKWEGIYIVGTEQVLGYRELSQPRIYNVKGGDNINQNYYLLPR